MKKVFGFLKVIFFVLAILALVFILKDGFNSKELTSLIFRADKKYLALSILMVMFGVFVKGIRIKELAKPFDIDNNLWSFTKIQTISISFSLITPGRVGEFTKIFLLAGDNKDKILPGTLICLFERFFDVFVLTSFSLLLCLFTLDNSSITALIVLAFIGLLLSLFGLIKLELFWSKIQSYLPEKLKSPLQYFIDNKAKLIKKIPYTLVITTLIWSMDAAVQILLLKSLGIEISIFKVIGINAVVSIMGILTILPLGLGTMDVSALFLYKVIVSLSQETILFLLAATRVFTISGLLLLLVPFMLYQRELFWSLYRRFVKSNKVELEK